MSRIPRPSWHSIGRIGQSALDVVFPPLCRICRAWIDEPTDKTCRHCTNAIGIESAVEACPTCAASVARFEVSGGHCRRCRRSKPQVRGSARVGPYGAMLGHIIRSYKYGGRDDWGPILADWLVQAITAAPWYDRIEAIVAVPTHWKHRLGRPFYAAEALGTAVAKRIPLPMAPVLRRVRAGPHQIGLNYSERLKNVHGAFSFRKGAALQDARILLIDDVRTTGATTDECARVLRRSGAAEVFAAVVVTADWTGPGAPLPAGV